MELLKDIYKDQLSDERKPKFRHSQSKEKYHKHLAWGFTTNQFTDRPKPFRTYATLFQVAGDMVYYTPNSFYRNDKRQKDALRWLNAMVVDVDAKHNHESLTFPELSDRIDEAGLPPVSLAIKTPSGGYHVYWFFEEPRRAFPKVTDHYERVQAEIAKAIGGDLMAIGAERWFRLPTPENTVHHSGNHVRFDDLCDWFTIQHESKSETASTRITSQKSLFEHPAVKALLNGVSEGVRDHTCYTLALTCKAEGYCEDQATSLLLQWNLQNDPPMTNQQVHQKVRSAYKTGAPEGPSSEWLSRLSGVTFTYQKWEPAKERKDRIYSHQDEWEQDLVKALKEAGGTISGSQKEIAQQIPSSIDGDQSIPLSTLKKVITRLSELGIIEKEVEGSGRGACTTIRLIEDTNVYLFRPNRKETPIKKNGFNSNTFIDQVVGGLWSRGSSP